MPEDRNYRFDPLSEKIDLAWSGQTSDEKKFSNYYDYFFSGEDIKVYIDGLFEEQYELDIASFSYAVSQEKQPLYGFWSYNYDAVMYGTRIISGEFSIYTRYPRRMTELIEIATERRMNQPDPRKSKNYINGGPRSTLREAEYGSGSSKETNLLSLEDEKNVNKYWLYSQLDRISNDPFAKNIVTSDRNIFSAHPPFNFIIMHGVEEVSKSPKDFLKSEDQIIKDNLDRMIISDVNERLVKPGTNSLVSPMKIIIQEIQLLRMATNYSAGGMPLVETYQFMARDFYYSEVDLGFIKNPVTVDNSQEPTKKKAEVPQTTATNKKKKTTSGNRSAPVI